jgi:phage tail-like protein
MSLPADLRFRAEANPQGPAIDLVWELPDPAQSPDSVHVVVLRRERRYPGKGRRGTVAVAAHPEDLHDGVKVYDTAAFGFDFEETREEPEGALLVRTRRQYAYQGEPRDRVLVRSVRQEFQPGQAAPRRTVVRAFDRRGLTAGTIYYYTAFAGEHALFSRLSQSSALATGRYGWRLFRALPQIHQRLDAGTPPPPNSVPLADQDKGQLERLTEVFEAHADLLRGAIDGLRDLHDPRRADARLLGPLARLIGWNLKDYLDEDGQRTEIRFAAEFYHTVGTAPNIAALVNRLTGWDAQVRDFVRNVLVTFDGSRVETLDGGAPVYLDGSLRADAATPPGLAGKRRVPPGSVNTADADAMFRLRTHAPDDDTAYTYDGRMPDPTRPDPIGWYNRDTLGIYIIPNVEASPFVLEQEWERVRQILAEFLPIQVRTVFVLEPAVVVEEPYDATRMVDEWAADVGQLVQAETYGEGADAVSDRLPGWHWFVTNRLEHRTVNTAAVPVATGSRTWHTGIDQGL